MNFLLLFLVVYQPSAKLFLHLYEIDKTNFPEIRLITKHPLCLVGPRSSYPYRKEPLILDFHYAVWTSQKPLKFAFGVSIVGTILMSLPHLGKFLSMVSHRWCPGWLSPINRHHKRQNFFLKVSNQMMCRGIHCIYIDFCNEFVILSHLIP